MAGTDAAQDKELEAETAADKEAAAAVEKEAAKQVKAKAAAIMVCHNASTGRAG